MRFQAPMTHICFREKRLRVSRVNSSCSHHTMEKQRHAGLQTLKPLTHSGTMHIGCRSMQSYSFCQHSYKLSARLSQMDPRFLLSKCLDISSPSPARPLHPYCSCSSKRHVRAKGDTCGNDSQQSKTGVDPDVCKASHSPADSKLVLYTVVSNAAHG